MYDELFFFFWMMRIYFSKPLVSLLYFCMLIVKKREASLFWSTKKKFAIFQSSFLSFSFFLSCLLFAHAFNRDSILMVCWLMKLMHKLTVYTKVLWFSTIFNVFRKEKILFVVNKKNYLSRTLSYLDPH